MASATILFICTIIGFNYRYSTSVCLEKSSMLHVSRIVGEIRIWNSQSITQIQVHWGLVAYLINAAVRKLHFQSMTSLKVHEN